MSFPLLFYRSLLFKLQTFFFTVRTLDLQSTAENVMKWPGPKAGPLYHLPQHENDTEGPYITSLSK